MTGLSKEYGLQLGSISQSAPQQTDPEANLGCQYKQYESQSLSTAQPAKAPDAAARKIYITTQHLGLAAAMFSL